MSSQRSPTTKPGVATVGPGAVIRDHHVAWLSRTGLTERTDSGEVFRLPSGGPMSWNVANKDITWDDLRTLPTTPAALKDRLVGSNPRPTVWAAFFNGIDALLSRAPSSPELRAALYQVLAEIPGIRLRGAAKDGVGRTGTAVELDGDDRRGRLVIAPKTALLLETGVYALGGKEDGRLVSLTTFLSVGPARTAPEPTGTPHTRRTGIGLPFTLPPVWTRTVGQASRSSAQARLHASSSVQALPGARPY
ncbi:hypothetical protein [Streptomyces sp. NPDC002205]|uniref:hypothetical protein n=1 Tax=Streptomyces sp. NPDC002205 TaxID=3154411 RepID=UPI003325A21F